MQIVFVEKARYSIAKREIKISKLKAIPSNFDKESEICTPDEEDTPDERIIPT